MNVCLKVVIFLQTIRGERLGRRLLDIIRPHSHTLSHRREIWGALCILVRGPPSRRRALLMRPHIEYLQNRAHLNHHLPVHRMCTHPERSLSPAPSGSSFLNDLEAKTPIKHLQKETDGNRTLLDTINALIAVV